MFHAGRTEKWKLTIQNNANVVEWKETKFHNRIGIDTDTPAWRRLIDSE